MEVIWRRLQTHPPGELAEHASLSARKVLKVM